MYLKKNKFSKKDQNVLEKTKKVGTSEKLASEKFSDQKFSIFSDQKKIL